MSIIKIDGVSYNLGTAELKRDAEIIYDPLTQGVMLDFSEVDDAVATKYIYSITIEPKHGAPDKRSQYDAFYYDITAPKSVREIEMPFGESKIKFKAKIKTVSDGLQNMGGISRWAGLTVTFLPVKPQRYNGYVTPYIPAEPDKIPVYTPSDKTKVTEIRQVDGTLQRSDEDGNWHDISGGGNITISEF